MTGQLDRASAGPCTLRIMVFAWVAVWIVGLCSGEPPRQEPVSWRQLPSLPDPLGVAGAFCGLIDDQLVVAGGANFPDGAPWEGGTKQWHSAIYCLDHPAGTWRTIGNLPHGLGYGVAISVADGLLCVGGSDADRHHADVLLIRLTGGQAEVSRLAPLPIPLALMAGAMVDNVVYVGGGAEEPGEQEASGRVFCLRLDARTGRLPASRQWEELPSLPGEPRLLPGAAALNGAFYLFGGVAVVTEDGVHRRSYLRDGWRWDPRERSWRTIADCPRSLAAGPSPSPAIGPSHFLVLGGDDGSRLGFQPVAQHPGFPGQLWAYHSVTDTWTQFGTSPAPRVTTGLVKWNDQFVIPSGEVRPGVRSPEVWAGRIEADKPRFGWVNYSVLAGYLLLVTAVGLLASGHLTTTRQFFRADQSIPWWAAGLSIFATMLSSITFMSIPAQGYSVGWNLFLGSVYVVLTPLIVAFYLPFFRRLDVTSAYEYLELRFSVAVRMLASSQFMLFQLGRVAVVLFLPSLALSTVAGIDITISIVSVGLLCVVYTMFGGMRAVIWTDAVQTAVLMGGALWALATLIRRIPGGVSEIVAVADQQQRFFGSLEWSWDYTLATGWIIMLGSLFSNLFSFTASQDVVQRYLTTADERTAARALWTNSLLAPPAQAVFFAIGTCLFVFYRQNPNRLDVGLANDGIFPHFIVTELPAGLAGLIVAAIFAASQSTISSSLNSFATAYVTDFHRRWLPRTSDQVALKVARMVTLSVGIAGIGLAITLARMGNIRSLWEMFLTVLSLFGGAVSGLFALGIFTRRANGAGALVGAVASVTLVGIVYWNQWTSFWCYSVIGATSCVGVGWLASWLLPGPPRVQGLTIYSLRAKPSDANTGNLNGRA